LGYIVANPLANLNVWIPFQSANDERFLTGPQTFTRSSTATYIDSVDGLIKTAATNTPRFEKMADGGTGILLEGASTNYLPHSDMNSGLSLWQMTRTTGNTTLAPDGITNVEAFTTSVANANDPQMAQTVNTGSAVGGVTFTQSVFIKGSGVSIGKEARLFLFVGGTFVSKAATLTADWVRFELTYKGVAGDTLSTVKARIDIINTSIDPVAGTDIVYCWGHQLEALPFASSYIPTTTAAVTRAADHLSLAFSGNAPRFDAAHSNPVSIAMDVELIKWGASGLNQHILSSSLNHEYLFRNQSNGNTFIFGGYNDIVCSLPAPSQGVHRLAVSASADKTSILGYTDGIAGVNGSITANSTGTATKLYIGTWGTGQPMYGHIRNFRIYNEALAAADIPFS